MTKEHRKEAADLTRSNERGYRVVAREKGKLPFELVDPHGAVVAVFKTRERAECSAKSCSNRGGFVG